VRQNSLFSQTEGFRSYDRDLLGMGSRDVIGHATIGLAICGFLLVINYNHTPILHGYVDMEPQKFWGHDLDLLASRDVICHVTIGLTTHGFLLSIETTPVFRTFAEILRVKHLATTHLDCTTLKTPFGALICIIPCVRLVIDNHFLNVVTMATILRDPAETAYLVQEFGCYLLHAIRAGSSMRLVRLKGPRPDRGPYRPVQKKFYRENFQSCEMFAKRRLDLSSRSATILTIFHPLRVP